MKRIKLKRIKMKRIKKENYRKILQLSLVSVFAVVGTLLLGFSRAANPAIKLLAPSASLQGAVTNCTSFIVFNADCSGNIINQHNSGGTGTIIPSLTFSLPEMSRYIDVPSSQLPIGPPLLEDIGSVNNGPQPEQGQFRTTCVASHFAYDDPIVHPGAPGTSHLHMFFGNTLTDASTTLDKLINHGGGSCLGQELNRTGYWVPALLDGKGNVKIPEAIVVYYKSKDMSRVQRMPQGLQIIAGESTGIGYHEWTCGPSGTVYNVGDTIPQCGSDYLHAAVEFPACWDGVHLTSADHISHMAYAIGDDASCPADHPVHLPQIEYQIYWANPGDTTGWYVSSDRFGGKNDPGGHTMHGDWWGGWNDNIMDTWINQCVRAAMNCSLGELNQPLSLSRFPQTSTMLYGTNYIGPNTLPLP